MKQPLWLLPAVVSLAFSVFTAFVVWREGFAPLWQVHLATGWGQQIGIDLVLAIVVGLVLLVPHARRLQVPVVPWCVATVLLGSIGLLGFCAHVLQAEARSRSGGRADGTEPAGGGR